MSNEDGKIVYNRKVFLVKRNRKNRYLSTKEGIVSKKNGFEL